MGKTRSNDAYQSIARAIPGIILIFDPGGRCSYASKRWSEYTGADIGHASITYALSFIHPEDVAAGEPYWNQAIEQNREVEAEVRLRRHDGACRWHRVRAVPECDAEGMLKRWVCVCFDIEEEREAKHESAATHADLNRAKAELERKVDERTHELREVVEQLEAFAYSIAHDMRAPLRSMHQYAQTVAQDFGPRVPEEARAYLNKIMGASEKLDTLVREVLIYTRVSQGRIKMQPIAIDRVLSDILVMHPQLNPPHIELNVKLPMHTVLGDTTALTQALSNLLANAAKFIPEGTNPKVDVWSEETGDHVKIFVKDNGIGIPTQDQGRIFKMFERLQPESRYEGSGIGLTIVRRAVERMGGKIGVESEEGQGSTFWIELRKATT